MASVKGWYDEIRFTPGKTGVQSEFTQNTGHYTQVVWKETSALGCGEHKGHFVCQYGPSGNIGGQFAENVLKRNSKSEADCGR